MTTLTGSPKREVVHFKMLVGQSGLELGKSPLEVELVDTSSAPSGSIY